MYKKASSTITMIFFRNIKYLNTKSNDRRRLEIFCLPQIVRILIYNLNDTKIKFKVTYKIENVSNRRTNERTHERTNERTNVHTYIQAKVIVLKNNCL